MSNIVFAIPTWLAIFLALFAPALVIGGAWLLLWACARVSAWADHRIDEVFASPPSITDGFNDMGEQVEGADWSWEVAA